MGIHVQALLTWTAVGSAIASVLDQTHVALQVGVDALDVEQSVANVAGIAMQKEDGGGRGLNFRGYFDQEQVYPGLVLALDVDTLERQVDDGRRWNKDPGRL